MFLTPIEVYAINTVPFNTVEGNREFEIKIQMAKMLHYKLQITLKCLYQSYKLLV